MGNKSIAEKRLYWKNIGTGIIILGLIEICIILAIIFTMDINLWLLFGVGIIIIFFGGLIRNYGVTYKEKVTHTMYMRCLRIKEYVVVQQMEEQVLQAYKNDEEYLVIKELFNLFPNYVNQFMRDVLHQPLKLSVPMNPCLAGVIGSHIGGLALGIAAMKEAKRKQIAYESNVKGVIKSQIEVGNSYDRAECCYLSIESFINAKKETKEEWESIVTVLKNEIDNDYQVVNL